MTPDALAALQDRAYVQMRPWSAQEFQTALSQRTTHLITGANSFLLAQVIPDEAEILAFATDPKVQRQGQGRALMADFESRMAPLGVTRILLDVASVNAPAIAFYTKSGFSQDGTRPNYYRLRDGKTCDAILMSKTLTGR